MASADGEMDDLTALRAQCEQLRAENARLRSLLGLTGTAPSPTKLASPPSAIASAAPNPPDSSAVVTSDSPVATKLALFRTLFRGREDVFALRWQNKSGRSGYAPACAHEWDRGLCGKPKVKCADCPSRALLPLGDEVIRDHLTGRHTV
ncbi:MAG TPA: restriction endonuclease subunit R, partial [Thermoleophilia bacterium]